MDPGPILILIKRPVGDGREVLVLRPADLLLRVFSEVLRRPCGGGGWCWRSSPMRRW
jgi:hypothetical protein